MNNDNEMKWLVIGISGSSCSGKTTIAKKLHHSIEDSILIKQDDYFLLPDDPRHILIPELNHFNWEIISSLDMSKMHSDITNILNRKIKLTQKNEESYKLMVLIIEGFLIYNYKPILNLCNLKYFINITKEICWNRRKNRVYNPPDVPGYFDKTVWPEYLRNMSEITSNTKLCKTITFLDGTLSIDELCNKIENELKNLLS